LKWISICVNNDDDDDDVAALPFCHLSLMEMYIGFKALSYRNFREKIIYLRLVS